jgi:uncharacterized protein (TIGR02118 family)
MIRVTVLYPAQEGSRFDHDYYRSKHIPMVRQTLGAALKRSGIERGLGTTEPGKPAPFMASGFLEFESAQAFGAAFEPHAAAIMGDIPNYTNVQPIVQIAEIVE